jgi:hypothetical protein
MAVLGDLAMTRPRVPLVDGLGRVHRPWSADPDLMLDYTLGAQVTDPYNFTESLVVALHHTAPDVVVLLGPGNSLGGPVAATLVQVGWNGARTRDELVALQQERPSLLSFAVPAQRELLVRGEQADAG